MEKNVENVKAAQEKFGELIQSEFERIERMKADNEVTDFDKLEKIVIGVLPGDGIGPIIMKQALRVLNDLLAPEIASGRIEIREIEGMTIENRAAKLQSLPDDVFEEIKKCNVIIKGPMVTPRAGEPWPNLVSANSLLRRGLERSQLSARSRFRRRTSTGPSSVRTLRVSTSGATRVFRSMMTWLWTSRFRLSREVSVSQEQLSSLQERTARRT